MSLARWAVLICLAAVAGCATPVVSVTDASSQGISFLVRNAGRAPEPDVDSQAAAHCEQHGMGWRRSETVRTSPTSLRIDFECVEPEPLAPPRPKKPQLAHRAAKPGASAAANLPGPEATGEPRDPKSEAWAKARTAADAWASCVRSDARRRARETEESPRQVAQAVIKACAGLENAVHDPLAAAGEDSSQFRQDLHMEAEETAAKTVASVRAEAGEAAAPMVSGNERHAPE